MYGNLATTTDARGKTTSFFYDDSTHALPTRVVVDPQNNTGTQTTLTTYDYSTGVVTSTTDANNNVSNIYYTNYLLNSIDPFGRPGLIKGPSVNGSRHNTKTFYNDAGRNVTVLSDLNAEGDGLLKSEVFSDELGRAIESRQYETASAFIAVRKTYDTPNRLSRTSNPFRAGETVVWTTTIMDVLGRVIEVKTPDNAVVSTAYDANFTTVTDQAGKVRRSMVDGLGRLIRVDEPNSSGSLGTTTSPNQPTSYDYDVLGNLRHVYQATQTRTFTYDALSRLRSADNPENGAPGIPDSGKISYNYDDNGNLSQKVDPRFLPNTQTHITTSYVYDALNRVTLRSYNDGTPAVTYTYDTLTQNGKGRLASVSSSVSAYSYSGYDATGRVLGGSQTIGSQTYAMSYGYDLAGHVSAMTYPSGRTVTNAYDTAGRLDSFTGTLGDGASRNYATGIKYSLFGGLSREQFGTNAAIYHTRQYNIRGQLYDVRASTLNDTGDWNRGAIVNYYSLVNYGFGLSGTDNNGNVHIQQTWIPNDDAISGSSFMQQNYAYDSLNRLTSVTEYQNGTTQTGSQTFGYDRWGNRTSSSASGTGISVKQFSVNPANNRLGVPSGQAGAMSYDNAGNLTTDTYSGSAVTRAYDAENRMTSELQANNYQAGTYSYDGDGRRIKRLVGGTETWQVYGLGGELLAEYAANAAPANPQKEYGYRNGELLITAEASAGGGTRQNVALAANGGVATAQNYTADLNGSHFRPADAIDGIRYAVTAPPPGDINDFWRDEHGLPSWVQIDFNGQKTIDQVDVITCRDYPNNALQSDPPATETFSQYGVTAFEVQYWTGTGWQTVPGGSITNNNLVWKQVNFTAVTTGKVRVLVNAAADNVARIMEVEVWGAAARQNVALTANGATATAQNYTADVNGSHYRPADTIDGIRYAVTAPPPGDIHDFWRDEHGLQSWVQIDFNGQKTIDEIDVFTLRQDILTQADPSPTDTFNNYGVTAFDVQYWNGSAWVTVSGGSITNNNLVWKKLTFTAVTTAKIRVVVNAAVDGVARICEVEAWTVGSSSSASIHWLVTDQLGTPRMVFDQTGSLTVTDQNGNYVSGMTRHDYLPFGEELYAGTGGRTTAQGYGASDGVRQRFTGYEHDSESGLDYAQARYYTSMQGRFTGVDPLMGSGKPELPQSWNRYAYCINNPLVLVDPDGLIWGQRNLGDGKLEAQWFDSEDDLKKAGNEWSAMTSFLWRNPNGDGYISFDRFSNFHEGVSTMAVVGGLFNGSTSSLMAGYSSKSNPVARMLNGIPNSVDAILRDPQVQKIINSPDFQFLSVYSGMAALEFGAASSASTGLSMEGRAFQLTQLNKHIAGTAEAEKTAAAGAAHVFNDLSTFSRVESEIFARGIYTGSRGGVHRYGLLFDEPIGLRIDRAGNTTTLNYGQLKLNDNGLYHVIPRAKGPGK